MHLTAVLVEHLFVSEYGPERRFVYQADRHEELRIEPETDLLTHLGDPVGREPSLPIGVIGKIGAGQSLGGAISIATVNPLRILPAERRERHDPGVEPDVADLGNPLYAFGPAGRAADPDGVDPRAVQLGKLLQARRGQFLKLCTRADDGDMATIAGKYRQWESEITAAGDVPVAHVAEPVVHSLAEVRRCPLDGGVGLEQPRPDLVDANEPVVGDAEDERRMAAPAERIAVDILIRCNQAPAPGQVGGDLLRRFRRG